MTTIFANDFFFSNSLFATLFKRCYEQRMAWFLKAKSHTYKKLRSFFIFSFFLLLWCRIFSRKFTCSTHPAPSCDSHRLVKQQKYFLTENWVRGKKKALTKLNTCCCTQKNSCATWTNKTCSRMCARLRLLLKTSTMEAKRLQRRR